jgi:hypothetical protein
MTPPTSIDGTDITGATIDGTDVQEITVDGQTVFSAQTLPVAYSNLFAWYPFDSSFYGGSETSDVTALFSPGQSGDSTAYDMSNTGTMSHQTTGGNTDINAGSNSGCFDATGASGRTFFNDNLGSTIVGFNEISFSFWTTRPNNAADYTVSFDDVFQSGNRQGFFNGRDGRFTIFTTSGRQNLDVTPTPVNNTLRHVACTYDGTEMEVYYNAVSQGTVSHSGSIVNEPCRFVIGPGQNATGNGLVDDVRIYDKGLNASEVSQIYQNTD